MEQPAHGCGGVAITGFFQDAIVQAARYSYLGTFSHKSLDQMNFSGTFQSVVWFYNNDYWKVKVVSCRKGLKGDCDLVFIPSVV